MSSLWNVESLIADVSFIVGLIVYSILSAFNKQLVTLKFDTAAYVFFCQGKKAGNKFFLKFEALSDISPFLSIFFGSQGGK